MKFPIFSTITTILWLVIAIWFSSAILTSAIPAGGSLGESSSNDSSSDILNALEMDDPDTDVLKVSTIVDNPYVYRNESCAINATSLEEVTICFDGFLIDLLKKVLNQLDLNFTLTSQALKYGNLINPDTNEWDGIIGDLINKKVDIGLAAFTVTNEREEVVDFTRSFTINVKKVNLTYALALQKSSPLTTSFSKIIYKMGYWGEIQDLADYWIYYEKQLNPEKEIMAVEH